MPTIWNELLHTGQQGQCLNKKPHRSAPGGSGAGGSVVIITRKLLSDPKGKISVSGGSPVKCVFGTGGGKETLDNSLNARPSLRIEKQIMQTTLSYFISFVAKNRTIG